MSPEERAKEEAWARWAVEREDALGVFDCTAGRVPFLANKFPIPKTDGMTPEEREATLARWRAEVRAFIAEADRPGATTPARVPVPPATSAPPEVPAS